MLTIDINSILFEKIINLSWEKIRFRGLAKNTSQLVMLFALSNLWVARRHLLVDAGEVRL